MLLMGTHSDHREEGVMGPGSGSGLSPPFLPTSGGFWVPSPEVTLQVVLKTLLEDKLGPGPRAWSWQGWCGRVWVLWTFAAGLLSPPSPREASKDPQGSPAACLPHSLSRESQHTIQARAQGQHGVPLTQSPNSPVPAGNHPFHL